MLIVNDATVDVALLILIFINGKLLLKVVLKIIIFKLGRFIPKYEFANVILALISSNISPSR